MGVVRLRMRWDPAQGKLIEVPINSRQPRPDVPYIQGDYETYLSPITGKPVSGRKAHREDLKKHGCRVYEGRESEQRVADRVRAEQSRRLDQVAERAAHRAWAEAPTRVRRILTGGSDR